MQDNSLTPDRWAKARKIICGDDPTQVSIKAAASAAGLSIFEFNKWVNRSRERDLSDDPWIWEIAEVMDERNVMQASTLEDVAWQHSIEGVREDIWFQGEVVGEKRNFDHRLLEKLLKTRDPRYMDRSAQLQLNINAEMDIGTLEKKFEAFRRMNDLRDDETIIDATGSVVHETVEKKNLLDPMTVELAAEQARSMKKLEDAPDMSEIEEWV